MMSKRQRFKNKISNILEGKNTLNLSEIKMLEVELRAFVEEVEKSENAIAQTNARAAVLIAELNEAQEELLQREQFLDTVIENIPSMVFIKDAQHLKFVKFNRSSERVLGLNREDVLGKSDHDFFSKEQADFFVQKDREVLAGNEILVIEKEPIDTPNGIRFLRTLNLPILGKDGTPEFLMGISDDITDLLKAEEEKSTLHEQLVQAQKLEAVGRLAGGIAHEFNNMLGGILGYASILLEKFKEDRDVYQKIKMIMDNSERAARMTKQLLGISRPDDYEIAVVDVNEVVSESINLLQPVIGKHIDVQAELEDDVWLVNSDKMHLIQNILNLGINSRDAMPKGGILIVSTYNLEVSKKQVLRGGVLKPGYYVVVSVKDDGVGIPENIMDKIFEPFFTTKEVGSGTGLGLAMIYSLVEKQGGVVDFSSIEGVGTEFRIILPADPELERNAEKCLEDITLLNQITLQGKTCLVVDDEEVMRSLAKDIFEHAGASVVVAGDGNVAKDLFDKKENHFDFIVLDVLMPGLNGIEVFQSIKGNMNGTKVIFSSGYGEEEAVSQLIGNGEAYFVRKPFSVQEILSLVNNVLK